MTINSLKETTTAAPPLTKSTTTNIILKNTLNTVKELLSKVKTPDELLLLLKKS